ncbi:hypothetical protein ACGF12_13650 [Kitasatospora sp. NPDC048296]|uniref:hypothetical protein n=1 Tax=Kitasatospora sp. NPDC048296 TaxID=3364048 RepID=UPI00371EA881
MASNKSPSPKVGANKTTNHGNGGTDPLRRTHAEKELVPQFSPFQNGPRYICRASGRYPDGTPAGPVPQPIRQPAPTTPLHPWPPVRHQADQIAA